VLERLYLPSNPESIYVIGCTSIYTRAPQAEGLEPYMAKYLSGGDELLDYAPEVLEHFSTTGETLEGNLAF